MAFDMTAAVKIQASVDGVAQINGLEKSLNKVDKQATGLQGAFNRLKASTGGLSGALGSLVPVAGIACLVALGKRSLDAADNLNDLSQRTGVGVESLSKFGASAADSGSNVDEVAKAMGRLARGVVDPASKANEALRSIGVSSTDASGKIKSMDQIMLDVADRFAKMPDGAQKTALAMDLFGKSGANMIPMLNQGREALGKYSATIDTQMAQAADKLNDSINEVARAFMGPFNEALTTLLPYITGFAKGLTDFLKFFADLPGPVQATAIAIGTLTVAAIALAPAISALIAIGGALAGVFAGGAIFATLAGYLGALVPMITAIGTALSGVLPILAGVFTGPVGWIALLVAAGVAIYAFRDKIGAAFQAIGQVLQQAAQGFKFIFIDPISKGFNALVNGIKTMFAGLGKALEAPFRAAAGIIKGVFNGVINGMNNAMGFVVSAINNLIAGANRALARLRISQIPFLPRPRIPGFADGGVVSGPTLAMVGEGGEREYIVPESKMAKAAANYLGGLRGRSVIPAFAEGGVVGPMGGGGAANTTVQITTGPVLQQDGQRYVTIGDLERALSDFSTQIFKNSRSYGGRRYQGAY